LPGPLETSHEMAPPGQPRSPSRRRSSLVRTRIRLPKRIAGARSHPAVQYSRVLG